MLKIATLTVFALALALGAARYVRDAEETREELREAREVIGSCDGVTVKLYTDRTDAGHYLASHCRAFEVYANQEFEPNA
jgi:hypothetical protein